MKLDVAVAIATGFIHANQGEFERVEVCGSIRRKRPEVNDIDLVVIPRDPENFLKSYDATIRGPKRLQIPLFHVAGVIKLDIYVANQQNFEVLRLIRMGSAEHNIRLCTEAKRRGWQLKANGDGLIMPSGAITTEEGILVELLGKYVEPEERT